MSFSKRQSKLDKLTLGELLAKIKEIENDPKSLQIPCNGFKFNLKARKLLDDISWAVANKLKANKYEHKN